MTDSNKKSIKIIKNNTRNCDNKKITNRRNNVPPATSPKKKESFNFEINIHPKFHKFIEKDLKYIKSKTIKEILKLLKLDGETFRALESHLNKEIKQV
tara:strand:+ start:758 stop:1051 length:294 start_codon:yes stop_codon:yes gene_type:complete